MAWMAGAGGIVKRLACALACLPLTFIAIAGKLLVTASHDPNAGEGSFGISPGKCPRLPAFGFLGRSRQASCLTGDLAGALGREHRILSSIAAATSPGNGPMSRDAFGIMEWSFLRKLSLASGNWLFIESNSFALPSGAARSASALGGGARESANLNMTCCRIIARASDWL